MEQINDDLRLIPYHEKYLDQAFIWYQDTNLVYLVDGIREPYTKEKLVRMYNYLNQHGKLYFIEYKGKLIGDITFSSEDLPIVIIKEYQGKHIGTTLIQYFIKQAKKQGIQSLHIQEIYNYNKASIGLFEKCGFKKDKKTEKGWSYSLQIDS